MFCALFHGITFRINARREGSAERVKLLLLLCLSLLFSLLLGLLVRLFLLTPATNSTCSRSNGSTCSSITGDGTYRRSARGSSRRSFCSATLFLGSLGRRGSRSSRINPGLLLGCCVTCRLVLCLLLRGLIVLRVYKQADLR